MINEGFFMMIFIDEMVLIRWKWYKGCLCNLRYFGVWINK